MPTLTLSLAPPPRRKVLGEVKGAGHADDKTELVASVPLRRWEDWERSRLRRIRREERRQRDLERLNRTFNNGNPRDDGGSLALSSRYHSEYDASDTASTLSSNEDDHWGPQIGNYNENNTLFPPPPLQFGADVDSDGEVVDGSDLEAMLDEGFDDGSQRGQTGPYGALGSSASLVHLPNRSTRTLLAGSHLPRFALNDGPPAPPPPTRAGGYANAHTYEPLANPRHSPPMPLPKPTAAGQAPAYPTSTTTAYQKAAGGGHAKQRSISSPKNANWGPGGPLMAPPADHVQASRS
jgi:chitin synthase